MASTKATELAQLSRKLTYNEGTDVAAIDGDGNFLTTGDTTDDLTEGSSNLYYTNTRSRTAISVSGSLSYDSGTGVISYTTPTTISSLSNHDTDDLTEGSSNLYYTDARSRGAISVSGDLSYNSTTGVISFTETAETVTSIALNGNSLDYTDENGTTTNIDLSAYLDEDSRAIASGTLNSATGIVTFTRDDATTFTLDLSALLDDTNLVTSVNSATGVVVLDTDDINEGSSNLYYTDARVDARITQTAINNLNVDADTVDGKHYDDIISEATALAIALG